MKRPLWMAGGLFFFALGWIGLILPGLPGVAFLLLALFCFARGNPAWEQRLLEHPRYGPSLREWRERRAVPRRAKMSAVTMMALGGALAWFTVGYPVAPVSIAIMAAVALWLCTRPE